MSKSAIGYIFSFIILVLLQLPFACMPMVETVLVGLAVLFTVVSGVDYIVKNKQVLKG